MTELLEVHGWARDQAGEPTSLYADSSYVKGYSRGIVLLRALDVLIDGDKDITSANLKEALESFRFVDTGGLTLPVSFTTTDHRPTTGASIYRLRNDGLLDYVTDAEIIQKPEWLGW